MKRKLNQSVDFANIKQEREKAKYEKNAVYKDMSQAMTYRSNVYDENLDRGLDLKNSPI